MFHTFLTAFVLASMALVRPQPVNASVGDHTYTLEHPGVSIAVGQTSSATVRVSATAPWHINQDFPISVALTSTKGVKTAKAKLVKTDAAVTEQAISFVFDVRGVEAGKHTVQGKLKFAICQDDQCLPVTEQVTLAVHVAP